MFYKGLLKVSMYLSYYNLKAKPFQMSTDPAFLWLGEKHREALAVLKYAILENKGVLALTGDVGTGKTTLINALLKSLGEDTVTATIYDPRLDVLDFFNTVAAAFRIEGTFDGKGKFILKFMDFLIKTYERNQKVLLIIDEAQGINEDLLEEIRLLSNLEAEYTRLLNIFFVGQNEFTDILQKYENRALRQRVTIRYHIQPLTLNETAAYIMYRLEVAGTKAPIFDSGAIDEIFFFSGGYPRLINIMCDHALLSGYVREVQVINANLIRECREELLVSKKKSEKDFQHSRDDYRSLPSETMFTEPPPDPFIPVEDSHGYSEPPPAGPFTPVEEPQLQEDEPMVFSKPLTARELATHGKPSKKRFYRSPIAIAFLLLVGLGAGYLFYSSDRDTAESFVTMAQQKAKKHLSVKTGSKNGKPSMVPTPPETSDIPGRVEAGKVGASRFFIVKSPNSNLIKENISKETETPQVISSNKFPEGNGVQTYTEKLDSPDSDGNNKTIEASTAGVSGISPEKPIETGSTKEMTPVTKKPVDTVTSNLGQKFPVIAPITQKTPDKIRTSTQMPSKIQSTSQSAASASSVINKKRPVAIPASKTKQSEIQLPASKPVEKLETATPLKKSDRAQKKTSERYQVKPEVKKKKEPEPPKYTKMEKEPPVESSVSSKKQATTLAVIPLLTPPKETVVSIKNMPGKDKIVSREKVQPKLPLPEENKAVNRVDEKVASLSVPASQSETKGNADFARYNLHARITAFLNEYCRTYEQKDLDKFSNFFAVNAVEKGKPFRFWLSKYRQNFNRIDSMEYGIELERYATQEESRLVKVDGIFHVRAKLGGSKKWRKSSGQISMVLEADGNSFKVKELNY